MLWKGERKQCLWPMLNEVEGGVMYGHNFPLRWLWNYCVQLANTQ